LPDPGYYPSHQKKVQKAIVQSFEKKKESKVNPLIYLETPTMIFLLDPFVRTCIETLNDSTPQ
jgi:preprotein translocase subunit SecB